MQSQNDWLKFRMIRIYIVELPFIVPCKILCFRDIFFVCQLSYGLQSLLIRIKPFSLVRGALVGGALVGGALVSGRTPSGRTPSEWEDP